MNHSDSRNDSDESTNYISIYHAESDSEIEKNDPTKKVAVLENLIEFILTCFKDKQTENIFEKIVLYISKNLNAGYVSISIIQQDKETVKTLAVAKHGSLIENFQYNISGFPLKNQNDICLYAENVQNIYPDFKLLTDFNAESFICFPLRDSSGKVEAFLSMIDDKPRKDINQISNIFRILGVFVAGQMQRIYGEKRIRENEFFFMELQKAAFIGTYKCDFADDYWESSEVLDQIFGIDSTYNRSIKGWLNIVHPDDKEMMQNYLFDEVFNKQQHFDKEYRIQRVSDNTTRWVHGQGLVKFKDNKALKMIGTIRDITQRKNYEEALKENEVLLHFAQQASGSGLWNWNIKTNKIKWTPDFFTLFGLDAEKDLATFNIWSNCIHPEDKKATIDKLNSSINEHKKLAIEYRIVHPDGKILWIFTTGETTYDNYGDPLYIAGICIDITSQKKIEQELIRSLNEQKTLNSFFVDRELRMIELKKEINSLLLQLGYDKKYDC
jgi:PAS domain S-box-containing protein